MPVWDPWPDFLPPPEYGVRRSSELLLSIVDLAQAVPPGDPQYATAQAALQKAQALLGHSETAPARLLRKWGTAAAAQRFAEEGDWGACGSELDTIS
jgi:hypothetical protein